MRYIGALLLMILGQCDSGVNSTDRVIYWVNSYRVECTGEGLMSCLQVQKGETLQHDQWLYFYSQIDGFDYEPGYIYRILVEETKLDPEKVPADGSSIHYRLITVQDKYPDPRLRINDLWALTFMEGMAYEAAMFTEQPMLAFSVAQNRVTGTDGCNQLNATLEVLTEEALKLGPAATTRRACPVMENSDRFIQLLTQIRTYDIEEMTLTLKDEQNEALLQFKKVD